MWLFVFDLGCVWGARRGDHAGMKMRGVAVLDGLRALRACEISVRETSEDASVVGGGRRRETSSLSPSLSPRASARH